MIVSRFLHWTQTASATARAEGARVLASAFAAGNLDPIERRDAEAALMALLDDGAPGVRRAIAGILAASPNAPHPVIIALANDRSDIAALVLGRSPILADAELIDFAAIGDAAAQAVIAARPRLSAPVAAALAEVGAREALIALAVNLDAELPEFSMLRMIERFGHDGQVREALLARPGLPSALRSDLVAATARALSLFAVSCAWMSSAKAERVSREAREKATLIIAADDDEDERAGPRALVRHLRQSGELTPSLLLRSLLCRNRRLFEAALGELSGVAIRRVAGLVADSRGAGFAALYAKAKLPVSLLPVFRAVLAAEEEIGILAAAGGSPRLSRRMIEYVLATCQVARSREFGGATDGLFALLRRLESEAAREEARERSARLVEHAHPPREPAMRIEVNLAAIEAELAAAA